MTSLQTPPMVCIPSETTLVELAVALGHQGCFIQVLPSTPPLSLPKTATQYYPLAPLPDTSSPAPEQVIINGLPRPLLFFFRATSFSQIQHVIANPRLDIVWLDLRDASNVITHEMIKLLQKHQKPLVLDLTALLASFGVERSKIIHSFLRISQRFPDDFKLTPITTASPEQPFLIRPPNAFPTLLNLLQYSTRKFATNAQQVKKSLDFKNYTVSSGATDSLHVGDSSLENKDLSEEETNDIPFSLALPPVWRPRPKIPARYLLIRLQSTLTPVTLKEMDLQYQLNYAFRTLFGEITGAHTHLRVIAYHSLSNMLLLRTTPTTVPHVFTMFSLLTQINGTHVIPRIIRVSGTMRTLAPLYEHLTKEKL